jgi:hypothetical protein
MQDFRLWTGETTAAVRAGHRESMDWPPENLC